MSHANELTKSGITTGILKEKNPFIEIAYDRGVNSNGHR